GQPTARGHWIGPASGHRPTSRAIRASAWMAPRGVVRGPGAGPPADLALRWTQYARRSRCQRVGYRRRDSNAGRLPDRMEQVARAPPKLRLELRAVRNRRAG